jgi:hypothetical protein
VSTCQAMSCLVIEISSGALRGKGSFWAEIFDGEFVFFGTITVEYYTW